MLRSLEEAVEFARCADRESVAIFVVDWRDLVTRFDRDGLWDERRLDEWLNVPDNSSAALAPLLKVCYVNEALVRDRKVRDLDAFDGMHRVALLALGYPDRGALRALCRDEWSTLAAPAAFAACGACSIALHRPRRAAPFCVTLLYTPDGGTTTEALRRSEARYRGILEDQTDFIVRYRIDGVRTFVNHAYADFFGGKPEDFLGKSFMPLVAPDHRDNVADKIRRLVAREAETLTDEHLSIRSDGVECWTQWIDRAIYDGNGEVLELQAVGRDLTEVKEAEQRLARAQQLEALCTMAAGLAHDFNNTLAAITGLAELILLRPEDHRAVLDCAEGILEATERASGLTRSLKHIGRRMPARLGPCDVSEIVEAAGRLLRAMIPGRIALKLEVPELPSLQADCAQLTHALINLGLNARDAITDQGTIEISARERGDEIVLQVVDDGAGVSEQVRAHLFEPFVTTKASGSGLGLAMVQATAVAHGGRVEVASELGRGSTFTIHLPRVRVPAT